MFNALHALAQNATLMIVVASEADQLRVSVTPTYTGDKPKAHALRPLVVTATPDELDADFAAALEIWRAPKRTLLEQAQSAADAAGSDDDADSPSATKAAATPKAKEQKTPRVKKVDSATPKAPTPVAAPQPGAPEGQPEPAPEPTSPPVAPPIDEAPATAPADTFTLDLF
jgi:PRTRC genetic system protein E